MTLTQQEFYNLSWEEQQEHIRVHEWFLGEKRNNGPIGFGHAFMDFCIEILQMDVSNFPPILSQLSDKLYLHCIGCGYLFEKHFKEENQIGYLAKPPLSKILEPFNLSSGVCIPCRDEIRSRKIFRQLGLTS